VVPDWLYISARVCPAHVGRLLISAEITELLDGRIEVLSELGHGSGEYSSSLWKSYPSLIVDFRFFIQCRLGGNPPAETGPGTNPASVSLDSLHERPPVQLDPGNGVGSDHSRLPMSKKVLIVEDNIINQTVLKRQLVKAGYTCAGVFPTQEQV